MPAQQIFRCSFWYLWSRLSLLGGALILIGTSISQIATSQLGAGGGLFSLDHLTFILIIGSGKLLFTALAVLAHIHYFPVIVDAEGIAGHTARGKRHHLTWSELSKALRVRHVGLPCYRLYSNCNNAPLVVPMCLKNWADFEAALTRHGVFCASGEVEAVAPRPTAVRRARPTAAQVREGGYIIISTEQRGLKSR